MPANRNRESFRKAASLLANAVRDRRFESVVFSSARPGEGTTTMVLQIARTLLQGYQVKPLVIELNSLRPTFAKQFHLEEGKDLDHLAEKPGCISKYVTEVAGGLPVIPCAKATDYMERKDVTLVLSRILKEIDRTQYNIILVDAPPLWESADTLAALRLIPRLMLVVRAGTTPTEVIDRVKRSVAQEDAVLVGAVLNRWKSYFPKWLDSWLAH